MAWQMLSRPNKPPLILKLRKTSNKWAVITEPMEPQTRIRTSASSSNPKLESSPDITDRYSNNRTSPQTSRLSDTSSESDQSATTAASQPNPPLLWNSQTPNLSSSTDEDQEMLALGVINSNDESETVKLTNHGHDQDIGNKLPLLNETQLDNNYTHCNETTDKLYEHNGLPDAYIHDSSTENSIESNANNYDYLE